MISTLLMKQVGDLVINKTFYKSLNTESEVEIRVGQLSWHVTKCVVLGRVISARNSRYLGLSYAGTLRSLYGQGIEDFDKLVNESTDSERAYLLAEWDLANPTTSHEIAVMFKRTGGQQTEWLSSDA